MCYFKKNTHTRCCVTPVYYCLDMKKSPPKDPMTYWKRPEA